MRIENVGPASARSDSRRWPGFRGVDRMILRTLVSGLLADAATQLTPAEMFSAVCETMVPHLALTSAGFFKRIAGQSRTLVWSADGVPEANRLAARERAWTSAAALLDGAAGPAEDGE